MQAVGDKVGQWRVIDNRIKFIQYFLSWYHNQPPNQKGLHHLNENNLWNCNAVADIQEDIWWINDNVSVELDLETGCAEGYKGEGVVILDNTYLIPFQCQIFLPNLCS